MLPAMTEITNFLPNILFLLFQAATPRCCFAKSQRDRRA